MNYLKELNAFRDWVMINRPSTGQVALWYSLMSINNMTGWKDWFSAPNHTLQQMTGLSRQGLERARNSLIQVGLIQYKKGKANQAGIYKINPLSDCQKIGTPVGTLVGTPAAQQEAHTGEQSGHQSGTLYKLNRNETKTKDTPIVPYTQVVDIYNRSCPSLPRVMELTDQRKKTIKARYQAKGDLSLFETLFAKAEKSDFLSGRDGKWTNCSFDWLLKEANMVKVLEGNYDNKASPNSRASPLPDELPEAWRF